MTNPTNNIALKVPCPTCKAAAGEPCDKKRNRGVPVHLTRADAAVRADAKGGRAIDRAHMKSAGCRWAGRVNGGLLSEAEPGEVCRECGQPLIDPSAAGD